MSRELGKIQWFGGYDHKRGRLNDFGFIDTGSARGLYVHLSQVLSDQERLVQGAWVTYERGERHRCPCATKLCLLADEKDEAFLRQLLERSDSRVQLAVAPHVLPKKSPAEQLAFLIEAKGRSDPETLAKFASYIPIETLSSLEASAVRKELPLGDRFSIYRAAKDIEPLVDEVLLAISEERALGRTLSASEAFWKAHFSSITHHHRLFSSAPEHFKRAYWIGLHSQLLESVSLVAEEHRVPTWESEAMYEALTDEDRRLAEQWLGPGDSDFARAQMLSARCAENVTKRFYECLGYSVSDVAVTQLNGSSKDWRTHDLMVHDYAPVDVKNSRRSLSGNFYVEPYVKRLKVSSSGIDVKIAGVLSPYLQLEYIEAPRKANFAISSITFLGDTSRSEIASLEKQFSSEWFDLQIRRDDDQVIPYWMFEYPPEFYRESSRAAAVLRQCDVLPSDEAWGLITSPYVPLIPAFLGAGLDLPEFFRRRLHPWQLDLYAKLCGQPRSERLTRPWLFLSLLVHFLETLKSGEAGDSFSPRKYGELLFPMIRIAARKSLDHVNPARVGPWRPPSYDRAPRENPAGLCDPLGAIDGLCSTLDDIWNYRDAYNLRRFNSFRLQGLGLLQGRAREDKG